jgi:hypothetical protein
MRKSAKGWRLKLSALVASAAGAAVILVGWHGAQRTSRAALLQLRVAPAYALVERQPPSPYVQHPTRGLEYSEGQLPFDVSSVPGSKSICDWVYCPTSSEAIQVSRWTPAEERAGMAKPIDVNDYAVTWTGNSGGVWSIMSVCTLVCGCVRACAFSSRRHSHRAQHAGSACSAGVDARSSPVSPTPLQQVRVGGFVATCSLMRASANRLGLRHVRRCDECL